jgi:hypothetical protein
MKNNDDFNLGLDRLNALYSQHSSWKSTQARNDHKDAFGKLIEDGEIYYSKPSGFINVDRLSRSSIEKVIDLIFDDNRWLKECVDGVIEERKKEEERLFEEAKKMMASFDIVKD